jgi:zeaxanthin glucosyltransferase
VTVILFILYHGKGHFNACFKLARVLGKSHRVIFAGVEFFGGHVIAQGFEYYPLKSVPFGIGLEQWVNKVEKRKHPYFQSVRDRFNDRLYKSREAELSKLIAAIKPKHILLDAQQLTDFIVLYPMIKNTPIKLSIIHTMLPSVLQEDLPPLNSLEVPGNQGGIAKAHKKIRRAARKRKLKQRLIFFGIDDHTIINGRLKQNHIPESFVSQSKSLFPFNVKNLQEFILAPKEFDFPENKYSALHHFIGSQIDRSRFEFSDPAYLSEREKIYQSIESENKKLIYCSLGTIAVDNRPGVVQFFKKLIEAIQSENLFLLISFQLSTEEKNAFTGNQFTFFNLLPQLEVLSKADLFITHGGLNSVKESIDTAVPMLVYPADSNYDPSGNSSRVIYHKLGLRGDISLDTSKEIKDKIKELLSNNDYKKRLMEIKTADDRYRIPLSQLT